MKPGIYEYINKTSFKFLTVNDSIKYYQLINIYITSINNSREMFIFNKNVSMQSCCEKKKILLTEKSC